MLFTKHSSITSAMIDKPMSLRRANIDLATLNLIFVFFEYMQDKEGIWRYVQDEEPLALNEHYRLDKRRGVIDLLGHPFWRREGLWRAADRKEPLLYKGQVKWPQVILFEYEHYAPQEVSELEHTDEIDLEAVARLGYNVPKYIIEESKEVDTPFDWEKAVGRA